MIRSLFSSAFILCCLFSFSQETVTINIDLGAPSSELPWNNLTNSSTGVSSNLVTMQGLPTEISITVIDAFNGTNNTGTLTAAAALDLPSTVSSDSFFGNTVEFADKLEPEGGIRLSGLDPLGYYDLRLFASRLASDSRETAYQVSGLRDTTLLLEVADNISDFVEVQNLQPDAEGNVQVMARPGPNNNNEFGFYYMGAIRLQYQEEQNPIDTSLALVHPQGGEYWQPGKEPEIRWKSQGVDAVLLEYSDDGGMTWQEITTTSAFTQAYAWKVPFTPTEQCLVRISAGELSDESQEVFTIATEDSLSCHLVVLGSSTAAGTGPSVLDSAWVWRYRDQLFQSDTRFKVTNLARGGFTTYNILPDGTDIPAGVNQIVDSERNVTQALSLAPDGILINLPSNDAANRYPVKDQLNNYEKILAEVAAQEIPNWICTPQPRNFSAAQIELQLEMRDSTFQRFGDFAVDFWTDLATDFGEVNPVFNSGDGVHLNDEGHRLLLERVNSKNVSGFLLGEKTTSLEEVEESKFWNVFPNPTTNSLMVDQISAPFDFKIYSLQGELLQEARAQLGSVIVLQNRGLQLLEITQGEKNQKFWISKL